MPYTIRTRRNDSRTTKTIRTEAQLTDSFGEELPRGVRPSDQAENNKTASRQRQNWLIKAASASKEIRLLLAPLSREHPVSHGKPGRAKQQKQQALNNNKNRARTNLGGSFGSPSSFRFPDPRLPPLYTPSPYTMLESAAIMRSSFRMQLKNLAKANCV